jgi:hypothetical protein
LQFVGGGIEGNNRGAGAGRPRVVRAARAVGDVTLDGLVLGRVSPVPLAVGFVWSATDPAPTLRDNDGVTPLQYVVCISPTGRTSFSADVSAVALPPGAYYMRAYALRPVGHGDAVYSAAGVVFDVPSVVTVTMVSVDSDPPLVLMGGQYNEAPGFDGVGFLWALTREDLTLERCAGSSFQTPDATTFFNTHNTTSMTPGLYYVTAFAQSALPGQPVVTVYAQDPLQFEVAPPPEGAVAMNRIVDAFPWLELIGVFAGSTVIFTQMGFVWATSLEDLTLEACYGFGPVAAVDGEFRFNLNTTNMPTSRFYVTAFARSSAVTLYGEEHREFYPGVQTPIVYTEQAFQEVYDEGVVAVHLRMSLSNPQPSFVPDTALYAFLCSATNPDPTVGGDDVTTVSATRSGNAIIIVVVIDNADPTGIVYVRAAAGLGTLNSPADNVLTVQRTPSLTVALVNQIGTDVRFQGGATYDAYPPGDTLARVQVQAYGYIWAKDRPPTIEDNDGLDNELPVPPAGSQPPTYVPVFPVSTYFSFTQGPGEYATCTYVQFVNSNTASEQQTVYSQPYIVTIT